MKDSAATTITLVKLLFGIAAVLLATGCIKLPPVEIAIPLDVDVNLAGFEGPMEFAIQVGAGQSFAIPSGTLVGAPIPDQLPDQMPFTDFPSEQSILDLVNDEIEDVTIEESDISEITLQSLRIQATSGNFSTVTSVQIFFVPKAVGGIAQDPILIGSANASAGFSTQIVFAPAPGVNLFELIQQNDANPAPGYPTAYLHAVGTVPEVLPAWNTTVVVAAEGGGTIETAPVAFCELPTEEDVHLMIEEYAGEVVANFVVISKLELLEMNLTAVSNDFSDFNEIHVFYVPKPVDGVAQPAIELGGAEASGGFGDSVTLTPPAGTTLDLLELVRENDANPSTDCPTMYLIVSGDIPDALPVWQTEVTLNAYPVLTLF